MQSHHDFITQKNDQIKSAAQVLSSKAQDLQGSLAVLCSLPDSSLDRQSHHSSLLTAKRLLLRVLPWLRTLGTSLVGSEMRVLQLFQGQDL